MPALKKFYEKNLRREPSAELFNSSSEKHLIEKTEPVKDKAYHIKALSSEAPSEKARVNTEPS